MSLGRKTTEKGHFEKQTSIVKKMTCNKTNNVFLFHNVLANLPVYISCYLFKKHLNYLILNSLGLHTTFQLSPTATKKLKLDKSAKVQMAFKMRALSYT